MLDVQKDFHYHRCCYNHRFHLNGNKLHRLHSRMYGNMLRSSGKYIDHFDTHNYVHGNALSECSLTAENRNMLLKSSVSKIVTISESSSEI